MYLYNISIIAEDSVHQEVAKQLKEQLIDANKFETRFLEMLESPHEGFTYCIQVTVDSEEAIQEFQDQHIPLIQALIGQPTYYGKVFMFDSKMKYIH